MGDFANFHMTFHLPKNLQIVATGKQVSLAPEGGGMVKAVWETDAPIPVAGFNLGELQDRWRRRLRMGSLWMRMPMSACPTCTTRAAGRRQTWATCRPCRR